jgi:hypothetical protein
MHNDTFNVSPGPGFFSFISTGTATVSVNGGPAATFRDMITVFVAHSAPLAGFLWTADVPETSLVWAVRHSPPTI